MINFNKFYYLERQMAFGEQIVAHPEKTDTVSELWNCPIFIRKRIKEQIDYIRQLSIRKLSNERYDLLSQSAYDIALILLNRLEELKCA